MKTLAYITSMLSMAVLLSGCSTEPALPSADEIADMVIAEEMEALDRWSAGHPEEYGQHMSEDGTYTDDIMAQEMKIGSDDVNTYLATLAGMVPAHDYEMRNKHVQVYGDVAVLSFHYVGMMEGQEGDPWRATTVYHLVGGDWKCVHANWSLVKMPPAPAEAEAEM